MASIFSTDEQKGLKETFSQNDTDNDGQITVEELRTILQSLSVTPPSERVQDVFEAFANQGKDTLDFDDFLSAMAILIETEK
ncbi:MAG: hypothetical protein J3Q66DRAFT_336407 [Benniella sp.]|nr:MAG: hypothetical protein J3Q66DRAFT_336407 [Benniella sp.]